MNWQNFHYKLDGNGSCIKNDTRKLFTIYGIFQSMDAMHRRTPRLYNLAIPYCHRFECMPFLFCTHSTIDGCEYCVWFTIYICWLLFCKSCSFSTLTPLADMH